MYNMCYYGCHCSGTRQIYANEAYRIMNEVPLDRHQLEDQKIPPADGKTNDKHII